MERSLTRTLVSLEYATGENALTFRDERIEFLFEFTNVLVTQHLGDVAPPVHLKANHRRCMDHAALRAGLGSPTPNK